MAEGLWHNLRDHYDKLTRPDTMFLYATAPPQQRGRHFLASNKRRPTLLRQKLLVPPGENAIERMTTLASVATMESRLTYVLRWRKPSKR